MPDRLQHVEDMQPAAPALSRRDESLRHTRRPARQKPPLLLFLSSSSFRGEECVPRNECHKTELFEFFAAADGTYRALPKENAVRVKSRLMIRPFLRRQSFYHKTCCQKERAATLRSR